MDQKEKLLSHSLFFSLRRFFKKKCSGLPDRILETTTQKEPLSAPRKTQNISQGCLVQKRW
jgi:hypothetical protein